MKKSSFIISFLLLGALILAACGGSSPNSSQPPVGTTLPGSGLTTNVPGAVTQAPGGSALTTGTPAASAMATQTQVNGSNGTMTETPTTSANTTTTPSAAAGTTATPTTSGSGAVPQTGTSQYALLSSILQSRVQDQSGNDFGSVNGVIIDRSVETSASAGAASATMTPTAGSNSSSSSGTVSTSVSPRVSFVVVTASGTASASGNSNNSAAGTVTATPTTSGNSSSSSNNANGSQVLVPWQAFKVSDSGSTPSSTSNSNSGTATTTPTATTGTSNNSAAGSVATMNNVVLVLTVDSSALASAPAFDASAFKGVVAPDVAQYWTSKNLSIPATGGSIAGTNTGTSVLIRGQIGSLNINGPDGKALGQVRDFVIDTTNGDIVYAILSGGSAFGGNIFIVPMQAMVWQNGQGQGVDLGTFQFSLPTTSFSTAPFLDSLNSLNLNSPDWKAKIDAFWNSIK